MRRRRRLRRAEERRQLLGDLYGRRTQGDDRLDERRDEHAEPDLPNGDPRAGTYAAHFADPSERLLLAPLARARDGIAAWAERLRDLTIRGCLSLSFAALVGLLALLAWLEAR